MEKYVTLALLSGGLLGTMCTMNCSTRHSSLGKEWTNVDGVAIAAGQRAIDARERSGVAEMDPEVPDGGLDEDGAVAERTKLSCGTVAESHGTCDTVLGWGFDGERCRTFSGCDCGADCEHLFPTALACALACSGAGQCNTAAFIRGGVANPLRVGALCDDIDICQEAATISDLGALFEFREPCRAGRCATGETCTVAHNGLVTREEWEALCAASLLNIAGIICTVWAG